jgi:hypothetical protein
MDELARLPLTHDRPVDKGVNEAEWVQLASGTAFTKSHFERVEILSECACFWK